MQITSPLFLFVFLPLVLLAYQAAPARVRSWVLLVFSSVFYVWGELGYVVVLFAIILFNHLAALLLEKFEGRTREALFWVAVVLNLALLGWFKYSAFLVTTLSAIPGVILPFDGSVLPGHLPLGVSFFTFLAISYLCDVHNEICPVSRSLKDTALFFSFFPKVVAGPLIRFTDFSVTDSAPSLLSNDFAEGVRRFIIGLARKTLLAIPLMKAADSVFNAPAGTLDMPTAWLGALIYALQIYHDFAGYSDMAIGLGMMFGYRLPENFDHPYSALSFTEFWRRWHITLSGWLRDYLFYPISLSLVTVRFRERLACGNASMLPRTCLTICCVFALCGIWHGAGWNFVLWGLVHGMFLSFEQTALGKSLDRAPIVVKRFYLLGAITSTWVLFRMESLKDIAGFFRAMMLPKISPLAPNIWSGEIVVVVAVAAIVSFPVAPKIITMIPIRIREYMLLPSYLLLFITALAAVAGGAFNPFIYARF